MDKRLNRFIVFVVAVFSFFMFGVNVKAESYCNYEMKYGKYGMKFSLKLYASSGKFYYDFYAAEKISDDYKKIDFSGTKVEINSNGNCPNPEELRYSLKTNLMTLLPDPSKVEFKEDGQYVGTDVISYSSRDKGGAACTYNLKNGLDMTGTLILELDEQGQILATLDSSSHGHSDFDEKSKNLYLAYNKDEDKIRKYLQNASQSDCEKIKPAVVVPGTYILENFSCGDDNINKQYFSSIDAFKEFGRGSSCLTDPFNRDDSEKNHWRVHSFVMPASNVEKFAIMLSENDDLVTIKKTMNIDETELPMVMTSNGSVSSSKKCLDYAEQMVGGILGFVDSSDLGRFVNTYNDYLNEEDSNRKNELYAELLKYDSSKILNWLDNNMSNYNKRVENSYNYLSDCPHEQESFIAVIQQEMNSMKNSMKNFKDKVCNTNDPDTYNQAKCKEWTDNYDRIVASISELSNLTVDVADSVKCTEEVQDLIDWLNDNIFKTLLIIIPMILIVLGAIDFGKVVISSDADAMKKATSTFVKRVIVAVAIFFVPTIVKLIFLLPGMEKFSEYVCHLR